MDDNKEKNSPSQAATTRRLNFTPTDDIQFGYYSETGEQIGFTAFEGSCTPAYGARCLKGRAEFEVKIVKKGWGWKTLE